LISVFIVFLFCGLILQQWLIGTLQFARQSNDAPNAGSYFGSRVLGCDLRRPPRALYSLEAASRRNLTAILYNNFGAMGLSIPHPERKRCRVESSVEGFVTVRNLVSRRTVSKRLPYSRNCRIWSGERSGARLD
jgi:hypothetical protein